MCDFLAIICAEECPKILTGDFNFPNIEWDNTNQRHLTISEKVFFNFVNDMALNQLVKKPTRKENILDLILTDQKDIITSVEVNAPFSSSDHNSVKFAINFPHRNKHKKIVAKCFSKCDFNNFNFSLGNIDWRNTFSSFTNIDNLYDTFTNIISDLINTHVPLVPTKKTTCLLILRK